MSRDRFRVVSTNKSAMYMHILLIALVGSLLVSCTKQDEVPDELKSGKQVVKGRENVQWVDMILKATDSSKTNWVEDRGNWPQTLELSVDSSWQTTKSDLTFAFDIWTFKNLDLAGDTSQSGLNIQVIIAASHVPEYKLVQACIVDSVHISEGPADDHVDLIPMYSTRRKFLDGVWQVWYMLDGQASGTIDFPENTPLTTTVFATWGERILIATMPPVAYQYVAAPKPKSS